MKKYVFLFVAVLFLPIYIEAKAKIFSEENTFEKKEVYKKKDSGQKESLFLKDKATPDEIVQDEQKEATSWYDPIGGDSTPLSFNTHTEFLLLAMACGCILYFQRKQNTIKPIMSR